MRAVIRAVMRAVMGAVMRAEIEVNRLMVIQHRYDNDHDLYKRAEELDLDLRWWTDVDNVYVEDHIFDNC